jgi:hypothetical protein
MYRKAHKCVRIAQQILGPKATMEQVEDKALSMLDIDDHKINAAMKRVAAKREAAKREACGEMGMYGMEDDMGMFDEDMGMFGDEDEGMFDDEDMLGMDDFDEYDEFEDEEDVLGMLGEFEQFDPVMGPQRMRMATEEDRMLAEMVREMREKKAAEKQANQSKEARWKSAFARMARGLNEEERKMLAEMIREKMAADDEDEEEEEKEEEKEEEEEEEKEEESKDEDEEEEEEKEGAKGKDKKALDIEFEDDLDPMGLLDGENHFASEEEEAELASLFETDLYAAADRVAAEGEDEEEEEEEEGQEEEEEEGAKGKKAAQRPRPRKPARRGSPRTLGNVHTAALDGADNEINELSSLWDTAPEVSEDFGVTPTSYDVDY